MVRYQLKHKNDIGAEVLFDEEKGALSEVLSGNLKEGDVLLYSSASQLGAFTPPGGPGR